MLAAGFLFVGLAACSASMACDTPVYRYAMYRWNPTPFEVYYFHQGQLSEGAEELYSTMLALSRDEKKPANIVPYLVDLKKDPELKSVMPHVRAAWLASKLKSGYVLATPTRKVIHVGELSPKEIKGYVHSAVRQKMADSLSKGDASYFLLLSGKSKDETERARKVVESVLKSANEGKLNLYAPPVGDDPQPKKTDAKKAVPVHFEFGVLDRNSTEEAELIKMLLAVEDDLPELDDPILFQVYGRGRMFLPLVNGGINQENLEDQIRFVTGACSCTVKEQNPGTDLLMQFDWETAAKKLADKFGSEEGNEKHFTDDSLFPELIIPSANTTENNDQPKTASPTDVAAKSDGKTAPQTDTTKPGDGESNKTPSESTSPDKQTDLAQTESNSTDKSKAEDPVEDSANPDDKKAQASEKLKALANRGADRPSDVKSGAGALVIGMTMFLALAVFLVATIAILRPR